MFVALGSHATLPTIKAIIGLQEKYTIPPVALAIRRNHFVKKKFEHGSPCRSPRAVHGGTYPACGRYRQGARECRARPARWQLLQGDGGRPDAVSSRGRLQKISRPVGGGKGINIVSDILLFMLVTTAMASLARLVNIRGGGGTVPPPKTPPPKPPKRQSKEENFKWMD